MKVTLPTGVMSLDLQDGTKYAGQRYGDKSYRQPKSIRHRRTTTVDVTDSAHLQAIADSPYLGRPGFHMSGADSGWQCSCGHGCWSWQGSCPRCGRERSDS